MSKGNFKNRFNEILHIGLLIVMTSLLGLGLLWYSKKTQYGISDESKADVLCVESSDIRNSFDITIIHHTDDGDNVLECE